MSGAGLNPVSKLFDSDGYITQSVEYDETEDRYIVGSHQNVAPVLDDLSERNNDGSGGFTDSRDMRHRARIPMALYDAWLREAYQQKIPVYHKREKDTFLKKKLAEHGRLKINGKVSGRLGFSPGYQSYWPSG